MEAVFGLLRAGNVSAAEDFCRDQLRTDNTDVNYLGLLGAILLQRGDTDEAEQLLLHACELAPSFAKPHEDLGTLYLLENQPADAANWFRKAVALNEREASAHLGLATALARCGQHEEAAAAQQRFLERSPSSRALAEAAGRLSTGDTTGARNICAELLIADPKNTRALRLLAELAIGDEHLDTAEGLLRRVVELSPDHYLGYSELAALHVLQSRFAEAIELFGRATSLNEADAGLFLQFADALSIMNRTPEALQAYEQCLALHADLLPALLGRGHAMRTLGSSAEAIASYRRCTELDPACGDAWWSLASMGSTRLSEADLETMQAALSDDKPGAAPLCFALARGFEANGDYSSAWSYYCQGNATRRREIDYDPVENETRIDAAIRVFDSDLLRSAPEAVTGPVPVFIVGVPRSGSTLIEQILASHSAVTGCGELPYIIMQAAALSVDAAPGEGYPACLGNMDQAALRRLGASYLQNSGQHRSGSEVFFTDKMPGNFLHIGLISLILPQAVFIDARRDPIASCVANFRQYFAQGKNQSYDLVELGEYYLEYLRLMQHWDKVLPGRILHVQYEDVVSNLDGQVRRMLEHCGLPFEQACVDFHRNERPVNTASSEQVRQPIYTSAIDFWKHYESELGELREILGIPRQDMERP